MRFLPTWMKSDTGPRPVTEPPAGRMHPDPVTLSAQLLSLRRARDAGQLAASEYVRERLRLLDRRTEQRPFNGADRRAASTFRP